MNRLVKVNSQRCRCMHIEQLFYLSYFCWGNCCVCDHRVSWLPRACIQLCLPAWGSKSTSKYIFLLFLGDSAIVTLGSDPWQILPPKQYLNDRQFFDTWCFWRVIITLHWRVVNVQLTNGYNNREFRFLLWFESIRLRSVMKFHVVKALVIRLRAKW